MKILKTVAEFQAYRKSLSPSVAVGFVPTMGALHAGHGSLLARSRKENDVSVLSIFVNPTQFNQAEDFEKYPKTWDADVALAEAHAVDVIFAPEKSTLYPDDYHFKMTEDQNSQFLCGEFRPGHFDGVLSVVLKLLNLAQASKAYFGEKDYQQLSLISGMARAYFLNTEIIGCPTQRATSGLALSSRNLRLTRAQLETAPLLYQVITNKKSLGQMKEELGAHGFRVEYLMEKDLGLGPRRLVAAWLGDVRLIDNVST